MRLNVGHASIRMGASSIHEVYHVTELDAGSAPSAISLSGVTRVDQVAANGSQSIVLSHQSLQEKECQLAIIVPCMNEEQTILEGVLYGIPHDCFIILVSNSNELNFQAETTMFKDFCAHADRSGILAHQQNSALAHAFYDAGMPDLIANKEIASKQQLKPLKLRSGKGEAMVIGTAIAKLMDKQFVGFVDADNFVPGAVQEYCKVFAAGLILAHQEHHEHHSPDVPSNTKSTVAEVRPNRKPHAMVRIKWMSKPKIENGKLVAKSSGRCSRVVNYWMNRLSDIVTGGTVDGNIIQTANAGEHAMSIDLAMELNFATGYAVEPYQLIDTWERSGPLSPLDNASFLPLDIDDNSTAESSRRNSLDPEDEEQKTESSDITPLSTPEWFPTSVTSAFPPLSLIPLSRDTQIVQIRTRNPHLHDFGKGEEHVQRMQAQGLSAIYHSVLATEAFKVELRGYMKKELSAFVDADGVPEHFRTYPPIGSMNFKIFEAVLKAHPEALQFVGP
ncbi:hypothetical protein ACN47E_001751 [Coniothyrium glycines]